MARFSLFDWIVPARAAALAKGTTSHALSYDDTHFAHIGHLSVGIMPAALAVAEEIQASAAAACDAFLVGVEAACRSGMVLGRRHYEHGCYLTATARAFGATVAAGRLHGLDSTAMPNAPSLVATRASGLKSQFGIVGKSFNAGVAASNGVQAAGLEKRGFVSCDHGFGGVQGFVETHVEEGAEAAAWADPPPRTFVFEDSKYKLHACCHGLHAMINALGEAPAVQDLDPSDITRIALRTNPRWMRVCDIKQPRIGLELKFGQADLAAMALRKINTAADDTYTDALCADPALARIAAVVDVTGDAEVTDSGAALIVHTRDGRRIEAAHDLADRLPAERLEHGLRTKARGLLGEAAADRVWQTVSRLDGASARDVAILLEDRA